MSNKYNVYDKLDLPRISEEILSFWEEHNIFQKSVDTREGNEPFVFYEGPPSANGMPGIHHVMARTIKDIFCRYRTLKGYQVKRKAGWDTHGLPVELGVEKELGITKVDIGNPDSPNYISIADYNDACKKAVMKYTDVWNDLTRKIGYWVDMDDPYVTYDNKYIESVWWLLKNLFDKDLLYKGYTIQPYSPKAGTGLSSHELSQPGTYRDVTDTTVVAQFRAPSLDEKFYGGETHILAWTTTPWTLPSNTALAVGPKIDYVSVRTFNVYTHKPTVLILAKEIALDTSFWKKDFFLAEQEEDSIESDDNTQYDISEYLREKESNPSIRMVRDWILKGIKPDSGIELSSYLRETQPDGKDIKRPIPYIILPNSIKGSDLIGVKYEQLMPYAKPDGDAFKVIAGDFVSTEDGTGIVHIAPTFGADDMRVAKTANIAPMLVDDGEGKQVPLVDLQGKFRKEVAGFAGQYVKKEYYTDAEIIAETQKQERDNYLSVDERIAIKLKKENKAFRVEKYVHSYPHCWRTDKPILYYPLDSWFVQTTKAKDRLIELNKTINWKPESTGTGRFGNWLENLQDWNLSRSRFWGIPLPIWSTEDKKERICIGS
ncbi:MAG: class I tRNA ligase family protein, partial [Flavobacteriales bacterium]|nr:class I tRNA ligase family protein [Flavobacteriales bacterium]